MIVVTGAAGFIASCLVTRLNASNFNDVVVVDNFSVAKKMANLEGKKIKEYVDRNDFFDWLEKNYEEVEFIFHLGARTDTTEMNRDVLDLLNLDYSKKVWNACCEYQIPLVYASSAATYGSGTLGYDDDENLIHLLQPLNPYGESKNDFDKWALEQTAKPFFWTGLKFFNVYGPNEYHKGRMASVILHAYNAIKENGSFTLFKSHNPEYKDGEQMRDFVYVKDVVEVLFWLMNHRKDSGIYNLGSGQARTFLDLTFNTFTAMGKDINVDFRDTPEDIRDKYQYYTQANMDKLRSIGYDKPFHTLEEGIQDYVQNYLMSNSYY
ncbi:ADP-glyceromanno-heptose 6-epimerase [Nibribacter koreensis]|uniref:ADP-L-glycero-D-manno-heptose-6-epimerase n=1 Tax=Nibribacter koreensis TaxID=1084519 RepID=A0ABP8G300_9BACT